MKFTWDPTKTAIMIGIEYIGDMDELMIFDKPLSQEQMQFIIQGKVKP
jgi:hypothetical protein